MNSRSHFSLTAAFGLLALCLTATGALTAAELATDFPKPPIPLELAPRMGRPFGDNAVFQQQLPVPVWGWTLPGAEVSVSLDQQTRSAKAGGDGRFEVKFDAMPADQLKSVDDAPAGHTLTVVTRAGGREETKTFSRILIGEVWLCSGQSNMARKEGYEPPVPTPDAPMPWLSIQAKDGSWRWAEGRIDGSDLIVSSKDVSEPIAVRYAYTQHPAGCNLYNKDGLPASPFSTCGY